MRDLFEAMFKNSGFRGAQEGTNLQRLVHSLFKSVKWLRLDTGQCSKEMVLEISSFRTLQS